jgi:hypothetical protein
VPYNVQQVSLSPQVVALAIHHLALTLAVLLLERTALALNPRQLVDDRQPCSLVIDVLRDGNPDVTVRRINRDVRILDVFAHHLDGDSSYLKILVL